MHVNHKSFDDGAYQQYKLLCSYAESQGIQVTEGGGCVARCWVVDRRVEIPKQYFWGGYTRALHALAHELGHISAFEKGKDHRDEVLAWDIGERLLKQKFGEVPNYKKFIDTKFKCLETYGIDVDAYYRNRRVKSIAKAFAYAACTIACVSCVAIAVSGYTHLFTDVPSSHKEELYY